MSKKLKYLICVFMCVFLTACAPYYHWSSSNYSFSDNTEEGLVVFSVNIDPMVELNRLTIGIKDITPDEANRRRYDRGGFDLYRSESMPERFRLSSGLLYETTRDDLVIAKLPPGEYEISYIRLTRREGYWIQYINKRDNIYQFEIKDDKVVYIGNLNINVIEKKKEKKMRFEPYVRDLSKVDLPKFYETMKNISKDSIITDILIAKANKEKWEWE